MGRRRPGASRLRPRSPFAGGDGTRLQARPARGRQALPRAAGEAQRVPQEEQDRHRDAHHHRPPSRPAERGGRSTSCSTTGRDTKVLAVTDFIGIRVIPGQLTDVRGRAADLRPAAGAAGDPRRPDHLRVQGRVGHASAPSARWSSGSGRAGRAGRSATASSARPRRATGVAGRRERRSASRTARACRCRRRWRAAGGDDGPGGARAPVGRRAGPVARKAAERSLDDVVHRRVRRSSCASSGDDATRGGTFAYPDERASGEARGRCAWGPPCCARRRRRRAATGCRRQRRSPGTGSATPATAMRGRWRGSRARLYVGTARSAMCVENATIAYYLPARRVLPPRAAAGRHLPADDPRGRPAGRDLALRARRRAAGARVPLPARPEPAGARPAAWRATSATAACSCAPSAAGARRSTSRRSARTSSSRSSGGSVRRASCAPPTASASAPLRGAARRSSTPTWGRAGRSASARWPRSADRST